MSMPPVVADLGKDVPRDDILYTPGLSAKIRALLDAPPGPDTYLDIVVLSADLSRRLKVRLWPGELRSAQQHPNLWFVDEGTCRMLDDQGTPHGPTGTCDGFISTVENPGGIAGKLDIDLKGVTV